MPRRASSAVSREQQTERRREGVNAGWEPRPRRPGRLEKKTSRIKATRSFFVELNRRAAVDSHKTSPPSSYPPTLSQRGERLSDCSALASSSESMKTRLVWHDASCRWLSSTGPKHTARFWHVILFTSWHDATSFRPTVCSVSAWSFSQPAGPMRSGLVAMHSNTASYSCLVIRG
ncbi:hypothetical protein EYF80_049466 [Liparis tanakae]|uniref:Uncharacterized protein n=1 Tax=Liparis tanakae TaxID=230148 RepID=A0A4Z2FGN6_9TELE|nr:hypothetical protein EYF80_049466 [Liparis tanakae]